MKRTAFTMIELVFVVVVIGVISAVMIPRMERDSLSEAAMQVASHIRYTQHLAMVDDKFDPNDSDWYKDRWQIFFANTEGSGDSWSYMIFSDSATSTGTPDIREHAVNPLDPTKYLSGGYSVGNIAFDSALATPELNLGKKFGINDIDFTGGCSIAVNRQRLSFDHLGRPFYGSPHLQTQPYRDETNIKLLRNTCNIELCTETCSTTTDSKKKITIQVEPETGYVHLLL
jgi:type II secretory pathway pseudopilin PulG